MMDPARPGSDTPRFPREGRAASKPLESHDAFAVQNERLSVGIDRERLRYRELFDLAPDAYLVTDVHGTIREANLAAGELLGVERKFLVGKSIQLFFEEGARREYRHQLDHLCDSDRGEEWEIWLTPRNRQRTPVAVSLGRARNSDHARGTYRWILRDITRRKAAEDALKELNRDLELRVASRTSQLAAANLRKDQLIFSERKAREEAEIANRVKSEFLALVSHEFRTPLQAIFGYTELLERQIHGPLNEGQMRDLKRIQQSQQHLLGLITSILDFARLDSGHGMQVELAPVAVNEVLSTMEGFIAPQLETKSLSYSYECMNGLMAFADAAKLEQIVLNLLANAIKFTPPRGSIALRGADGGDTIDIEVRDTGIGIPADKLESIFEPFVQLKGGGVSPTGTGLGLSISRRLATAMGGQLSVASEPGSGSTFTLSLRRPLSA
jgi:PAS domain S-box-containing protein